VPEGRRVFATLTVRENLIAAARPGPWDQARVEALFPRLAERRDQRAATLSGGEHRGARPRGAGRDLGRALGASRRKRDGAPRGGQIAARTRPDRQPRGDPRVKRPPSGLTSPAGLASPAGAGLGQGRAALMGDQRPEAGRRYLPHHHDTPDHQPRRAVDGEEARERPGARDLGYCAASSPIPSASRRM